MTNSKELFNDLVSRITLNEDKSEIQSIIYLLLEKELGLTKMEILSGKEISTISPSFFYPYVSRINNNEPIQYILGESIFYGRSFTVNSSVLIPRPETELLVDEIKSFLLQRKNSKLKILDIGTGSGCLAITLTLEFPQAAVYALDVSSEAIRCAIQNALTLNAQVSFNESDILKEEIENEFDLIVSNPPYISDEEKKKMKANVLEHEPHLALFAPGLDPLIFYRVIGHKALRSLSPEGTLWMEINEHFGKEIKKLLEEEGYRSVKIIKDLDNKDRIVAAYK